MAPETRRAGRDQVALVSHKNSMETVGTAQDQIQFEMADADTELIDALSEHTEPIAADAHNTAQGI
jgi:hypothetical protein